jgi:uncharacterized membrane protein YgdD (TMEM256/DUF423 family)
MASHTRVKRRGYIGHLLASSESLGNLSTEMLLAYSRRKPLLRSTVAIAVRRGENRRAMRDTAKFFLILGSLLGAAGVALGAFGAHALKARLGPEMLAVWQTAVQYHLWHALALVAIGVLAIYLPASAPLKWAGWLMAAGIVLFSGSLYVLAFAGVRWLGAITPFGGAAFIAGWILLAWAAARA